MEHDIEKLVQLCKDALLKARETLSSLGEEGVTEAEHDKDIVTKGDLVVSEKLTGFFREAGFPAVLLSEEGGREVIGEKPRITIAFDDIDGTNNYHKGRGVLPHCTVVTIFDSPEPRFKDALVAGIIEHNSGFLWHAARGQGCYLNGKPARTSGKASLDRRTDLIIDHYMTAEGIKDFLELYPNSWPKDFSCSAIHYAGISSGMFDAYLCPRSKAHELGAGYLMVKEAGGHISDIERQPLDDRPYDFNATYPVVIASTRELAEAILQKIE